MKRRDFLKAGAAAGANVYLTSKVPDLAQAASPPFPLFLPKAVQQSPQTIMSFAQWGQAPEAGHWRFVTGDFNGDGKLDIAGFNADDGTIWVGINTGSGFSFSQWGAVYAGSVWSFVAGHFTGSGRVDILGYANDGSLWVGANTGSGFQFTQWNSGNLLSPPTGWYFVPGDFNGDGRTDLMGYYDGNGSLWVMVNNGNSTFTYQEWGSVSPALGWTFYPGDFNGDGWMDVVGYYQGTAAINGQILLCQNQLGAKSPSPSFLNSAPWATLSPPGNWYFAPGHYAGDSHLDLMGFNYVTGQLNLFRNLSGAPLPVPQAPTSYPGATVVIPPQYSTTTPPDPSNPYPWPYQSAPAPAPSFWMYPATWNYLSGNTNIIYGGDFNNDGIPDVLAYNLNTGVILVGINKGLTPEGYAWPLSAAPGQTINFMVSGAVPSGTAMIYQHSVQVTVDPTGHHQVGDVLITQMSKVSFTPSVQAVPPSAWETGCGWKTSFSLTIPHGWPSGVYSACLVPAWYQAPNPPLPANVPDPSWTYITFIVKPDPSHRSTLAVLANANTWNAYNQWGGQRKYDGVPYTSFLRPDPDASPVGQNFANFHLTRAELWVLAWLQSYQASKGLPPPDVYTNLDLNTVSSSGNSILLQNGVPQYKRLVLSTHPEYFTQQNYAAIFAYLENGGSLISLGGNTLYEVCDTYSDQTGLIWSFGVPSTYVGQNVYLQSTRTPYLFRNLPFFLSYPFLPSGNPNNHPEVSLLGIAAMANASGPNVDGMYYTVNSPNAPSAQAILAAAGVSQPDHIGTAGLNTGGEGLTGQASGSEIDNIFGDTQNPTPPGALNGILADANTNGQPPGAYMVYWQYVNKSGKNKGWVYAVGSICYGGSLVYEFNEFSYPLPKGQYPYGAAYLSAILANVLNGA